MKNIVICCDGTNNQFGSANTNVVSLFQTINRDPKQQLAYYDPGVGTMPEPGAFSKIQRFFSVLSGLAFGRGVTRNIEEAYIYLMNWYEAGDRIFLFGFSRGAYTVRALAGVIHHFGLLPAGMENLVPYMLRLAREINEIDDDDAEAEKRYWKLVRGFRVTFARSNELQGRKTVHIPIHFLGVWDTVSSVGWVWDPKRFPSTAKNRSISIVRHAVSIDERRWFFRQNQWTPSEGQDVLEVWFPGDHCDVGGGHAKDGGLSQTALVWVLREAKNSGLILDGDRWAALQHAADELPSWGQPVHDLLFPWWIIPQLIPKFTRRSLLPQWGINIVGKPPFLAARRRIIPFAAWIHGSCARRAQELQLAYRPENMSDELLSHLLSTRPVPELIFLQNEKKKELSKLSN